MSGTWNPLPIAPWGRREVAVVAMVGAAVSLLLVVSGPPWRHAAVVPLLFAGGVAWFFRDPPRVVPTDHDLYLAPADGKVVEVTRVEHDRFLDGPATRIGIFLSLFNVHVNRTPRHGRVLETDYQSGEHRSALVAASADRNEHQWIGFEDDQGRRYALRQIAGLVTRRIVCDLRPGDAVEAGQKFGMIKFGSRTELIVPDGAELTCQVDDRVRGGVTVLARVGGAGTP